VSDLARKKILIRTASVPVAAAAAAGLFLAPTLGASAAPITHGPYMTHHPHANRHPYTIRHRHAPVRSFRTRVAFLPVRTGPSRTFRQASTIRYAGTLVTARCYRLGQHVGGSSVWYLISTPRTGYVAGGYLVTGGRPVAGLVRCK
jgi:hypothetical protein